MPTTKRKSQDRRRVSAEKHEISYTGTRVAKAAKTSSAKGKKAVKSAKKQLGRSTGRKRVVGRAKKLAAR
jgi:hypothetical protein